MEAFDSFLTNVENVIVNPLITLIALGALLFFAWGVIEFIQGASEPEKRKKGQRHMVWGLIGLGIVFGAQAILGILARTIGVEVPE